MSEIPAQQEDSELVLIETDRLLLELERRFDCGILFMERQGMKLGTREGELRGWGDKVWGIGAAHILLKSAEEQAKEVRGKPTPEADQDE